MRGAGHSERATFSRAAGPTFAIVCFIAVSVLLDRDTAHQRLAFHDARSPLTGLVSLLLVAVVWRRRHRLPAVGRVGILLCLAGVTANLVCLATDPDGVSDYLHISGKGYTLAFNIADAAIWAGLTLGITSVLGRRLLRARQS